MVKISWPKFRNPFGNPVNLSKVQARLFGKKKSFQWNWRSIGRIALWGLAGFVLLVIFLFAWFAKDLPTPGKIRNLVSEASTRLYDRNMKPLYTISGDKKRILLDGKDIPDIVRQATLALEDRDFYNHPGVDPKAILRSIVVDISRGQKAQGGSTITQQYVRLAILKDTKKNFTRKIKEAILSIEVEALFSKDQILNAYLNEIPYGGNNYGIEAAARSFYNKSAKDLTIAEAATLAALPQQPSTLSPYGPNADKLLARRDYALDVMRDLGYITTDQATQAKAVALGVVPRRDSIVAPHFVLYVKDWLVNLFTEQLGDRQLAEQKVEGGGLTVVTTLDLDKQQMAEEAVHSAADGVLKRAGASNAGLVSLDAKRGEIMAMVGSVDYFQPQFGAFNIATAERQPGSSFKPIVYATAFKDKYSPGYTLFDFKTDFGNYEPDNYDNRSHGPLTIRQALGNSYNIPAVKTLALVGVDKALQTAHDMGITTLQDKDRYGLSLVLGGGEVKLVDMATAYSVFANNGTLLPTTPVLKITDAKNKELYNHENPKDGREVLDPVVAYEITSILSDTNAKRPTFSGVMNVLTLRDRPVASKTGTTNAYRDAWTIGFTPQYVTAVWAGNNDNSSMNRAGGSVAAAPIWHQYMEKVHQGLPVEQFVQPGNVQEGTIDRYSNKLPVNGSELIKDIFAKWQLPTENDDVHQRVRVCRENGLLADGSIPNELTEERTFTVVRSEMPDNPNWENPVRAWAQSNGLYNPPPTQKCNASDNTKPSISITAPTNGATVSGTFTISASASAPSGVQSVEFLIDNTSIGTVTSSPYQTSYNANQLSNGSHTITAIVTSNSGSTASDQVTVSVSSDTTPPANVTNFHGTAGASKAILSWTNPNDADFKSVRIYYRRQNSAGQYSMIEVASPGQSVVISSLSSGVAYEFVAKSVDTSNNESSGVTIFLTPL